MDTIRKIANDPTSDGDTLDHPDRWLADNLAFEQELHGSRSVADTLTAIDQGLNPPEPTSARNKRQRDDRADPNPSPTKAPAAVRARGGKMTLPRRPSGGLTRSPQRAAATTEAAAPRPRRGQRSTTVVPQDEDADVPIAGEQPDFAVHVRLLLPQTQSWEQPVVAEVEHAEDLDEKAKDDLHGWFVYFFEKSDPEYVYPFWLHAKQIDEKCLGCKTITKRDSPWDELKIRACKSCIKARRPCIRMCLITRGNTRHRQLRVLPRGDETPFNYWDTCTLRPAVVSEEPEN